MTTEDDQPQKLAKRRAKSADEQLVIRLTIPKSHRSHDALKALTTNKERTNRILFKLEESEQYEGFAKLGIAGLLAGIPQMVLASAVSAVPSSADQVKGPTPAVPMASGHVATSAPTLVSVQDSQGQQDREPGQDSPTSVQAQEENIPVFDLGEFD